MLTALAFFLVGLTGVSFGLIGAGGAILMTPIMVYMMGVSADKATGYALPVSLLVSSVGASLAAKQKQVHFQKAFEFGVPTALVGFLVRAFVLNLFPAQIFGIPLKSALMYGFAGVLLLAAIAMIKGQKFEPPSVVHPLTGIALGMVVGIIGGVFGIGGGFMIIPILVLYFGIPMKDAVGTSLFAVSIITLFGSVAEVIRHPNVPWGFIASLMACAATGMVIGSKLRQMIDGKKLKTGFGYFILFVGMLTVTLEYLRSHPS